MATSTTQIASDASIIGFALVKIIIAGCRSTCSPTSSAASRHLPQLLRTGPTGAKEEKRSLLSRLLASVMAGTWNSRARKRSRPACQNLKAKLSKAQRPSCKRQDLTRPHTTPLSQSSLGRKLWVGKASLQHCEGSFCSLRQTWIHMA